MHEIKPLVEATIEAELRPRGFERDGSIWFIERDGIVAMLALVRTPDGSSKYAMPVGLHVRALARADLRYTRKRLPRPVFGDWDVYGNIATYDRTLAETLDGGKDVADEVRESVVRDRLRRVAVPRLTRFLTRAGIARVLAGDRAVLSAPRLHEWVAPAFDVRWERYA